MMVITYSAFPQSNEPTDVGFFNSDTMELQFIIVADDQFSNGPSGETKTYKSNYTRNIAVEGGEFDGIIIVYEVPIYVVPTVLLELSDKLTDSVVLRRFMIDCLKKKWIYPKGFVRK